MDKTEATRIAIIRHIEEYPECEIADIFKFIFQSACGCEHMVSDRERVLDYIRREAQSAVGGERHIDALDGDFCRVHLSCIGDSLSAEELADMFLASARHEPRGKERIKEKLAVMRELVISGELKLDIAELDAAISEWAARGYPAIHHSDRFREKYRPAYRVIHNDVLRGKENGE